MSLSFRAFVGLLEHDLLITRRQLGGVLAQVLMQPLLMLLVFGKVLGALGYTPPGYARLLLPGLVALNAFFAPAQNASFPLAMDFVTGAITTRLQTPASVPWIVLERVVAASVRGVLTALLMIPVGLLLLGDPHWNLAGLPAALGFIVLGALTGGAVGVTIGSLVSPGRIGPVFALVMPPLLFTGSAQFPFPQLSAVPWFRVVCAANPMTYVSEGLRGALTPDIPHLPGPLCAAVLTLSLLIFGSAGLWAFRRRAVV
ncbi:ABC transporter permease [Pseudonocardiaceae bacterium YIM PH 21723]|nr:ABC transporter permease [Pseudonocardiaceae bacterium YIM PH 21723]